MEKIKSVLSGHKKSEDATHDAQTSSSAAHHDSQTTPIYKSMKSTSSTQPTTAGAIPSAGQTGTSTDLGQTQHTGTGGLTGSHSAAAPDSTRPDLNPMGAGHMHQGISEASIKSGVIGFGGAGQRQEHAALSSHNPESELDSNQIVGGGSSGHATTTNTSEQPSTLKQALPLTGNSESDKPYNTTETSGHATQSSTSRQPFDQSLRQESYTNDTDRSFPLAGGVASKHDPSSRHTEHPTTTHESTERHTTTHQPTEHHTSSSRYPIQQSSSTNHPLTSAREPGTKEKEVGVKDGYGREGLAGAAAAATGIGAGVALSQSHQRDVQSQGQETRQATYGDQPSTASGTIPTSSATSHVPHSNHPEALAVATAAASKSSTLSPSAENHSVGVPGSSFGNTSNVPVTGTSASHPQGTSILAGERPSGNRSASHRHIPGEFPSPTPDESKTFLYYRDEVVPEPGVDGPVYTAHKGIHPEHQDGKIHPATTHPASAIVAAGGIGGAASSAHGSSATQSHPSGTSTAGPHQSDLLNQADPRVDSDLDGSRSTQGQPTNVTSGTTSTSAGVPSGQHELRHTGSLEQPTSRSSELADDHHGRDATIAGGLGAGAAGLGYAASRDRNTSSGDGSNLPQESSPYSSKQLDPRALGSKVNPEDQRHDQVGTTTHHPTSNVAGVSSTTQGHHADTVGTDKSTPGPHKSSLLNKLDPRVKNESSKATDTTHQTEPQNHHGGGAALISGGVATGAGARHELSRNDTSGAGTAILPDDQPSRSTGPTSSATTAPQHPANTSAPLSSSITAPQQSTPLTSSTTSTSHPNSELTDRHGKPYDTYHGPKTTDGSPFYGAVGAPAPIEDKIHHPTSTSSTASPQTQQHDKDHDYGRNAGLAGAGLATAGGLAHAGQRDDKTSTGPASNTIGQHSSNTANVMDSQVQPDSRKQVHHNVGPHSSSVANTIDPRVQSDPSKQHSHTTTGPHQSDTLNRIDPKVDEKADQHHYGRDAAVLGGTGAAGYGAHEATKAYGDHRSTQPSASMNEQRYDTSAPSANPANPVPTSGQYDYNNDNTRHNVAHGSGAALGAGALGGAAYAGTRHSDTAQVPTSNNQSLTSSSHPAPLAQSQPTQSAFAQQTHDPSTATYPTQGLIPAQYGQSTAPGTSRGPQDSIQDSRDRDHTKRDAALLGTGAAAAGGAAYAYSQNQDADRERARLEKEQQDRLKKEQHDREKEQHKLDKEHSKQEKEAHKLEKEQHKHEKAIAAHDKTEHKHEKEQEKEAARLEKEREKEAKRLEKENEPEKKHGILGFLHRDKSKKDKSSADSSPRQSAEVRRSVDNKRHSKEYAAGGAVLGAGTTAAAYDDNNPDSPRWKGKNKLHKDPPPGHPARDALEHHEMGEMEGGKRQHMGVDGPIGDPNAISGYQETRHNTYGAVPVSDIQHSKHVIEPHTGLPMNVGKYGDGHGGTDGSTTIHGHHGHETGAGAGAGASVGQGVGTAPGNTTTDWNAIKKADTPY